MGGTSTRNLNTFRKLCGDGALQNVVMVTNMWGEVDPHVGDAREAELVKEDNFFKSFLDNGAQIARHNNTIASAKDIIRLVLDNHPLPLRIQVELVIERRDISETSAGKELNQELDSQIRKNQEEIRTLKREIEWAVRDKDEETMGELERENKRIQEEVERVKKDAGSFAADYRREKERIKTRFAEVEDKGRREVDPVATQLISEEEAPLLEKAEDPPRKGDHAQLDMLSVIGAMLGRIFPLPGL